MFIIKCEFSRNYAFYTSYDYTSCQFCSSNSDLNNGIKSCCFDGGFLNAVRATECKDTY